jgi:hypothetical protein
MRFEEGGCNWCKEAMVFSERITNVMGWRALVT